MCNLTQYDRVIAQLIDNYTHTASFIMATQHPCELLWICSSLR